METPPRPEAREAAVVGDLALFLGLLSVLSPFVAAMPLESAPLWIFVIGLLLAIGSLWLAALAMRAPGGARGRGTAGFGIASAILGIAFSGVAAAVISTINNDTAL